MYTEMCRWRRGGGGGGEAQFILDHEIREGFCIETES
jgi:hypothetical protein